jgi:hypothetical protein
LDIKELQVFVGDESAGFDPTSASSYATQVFAGIPSPDSSNAELLRSITFTGPTTKRYFLFRILSNYLGTLDGSPDRTSAFFGNILVNTGK